MEKDDRIGIRLPTVTKDALLAVARKDGRTLSALISKVLADWLRKVKGGKR